MQPGRLNILVTLGALALATVPLAMRAQEKPARVELITSIRHAVSPPMREIVPTPPSPASGLVPLRRPLPARPGTSGTDPVLQSTTTSTATSTSTSAGLNFDGISSDGYIPPDTNLAVGATQVVQTMNVEYAVYDKATGAQIQAPRAIHNVFAALGSPCGTSDGGDPVVLYDKAAGRWLISQLEYNRSFTSDYECVAISQTSDATGSFNLYSLSFGNKLPDYPKWGSWPDAYYLSANIFVNGSSFNGASACALPRSRMLAGLSVDISQGVCFQLSSEGSLLPADLDGTTAPSAGEPEFYANFDSSLELYRFHVDFTTPSNSTFTGPIAVSGAASFNAACSGGTCIPQPGTNQQLDSLGDRLMFRLAYRNFGSYESLVVTHSVQVSNSSSQSGIRWYEIRSPNSSPTAFQQGTYSPDSTTYRWMGSIAQDQNGDIAVGYSVSDASSVFPGIRFAGRVFGDPINTLEPEATIVNGGGSQSGSYGYRWGDYSAMSMDPSDDCTFWYTTEYEASSGSFNWHTRIASFKFSGCGATTPPAAPTGLTASPGNAQVSLAWNASSGATSYTLLRSTTGIGGSYTQLAANVATTSYTDSGLTNGSQYCYEVEAVNSIGPSSPSSPACATPVAPPATPTGLSATGGNAQVGLAWNASTGATSYTLLRSVSGGGYSQLVSGLTSTSYTDTGLTNGTQYCYEVEAVNAGGASSPSGPQCATPVGPPPAPTGLTATAGNAQVSLAWNASTGATSYTLLRSVSGGSYSQLVSGWTSTSYTDTGLTNGTQYCYEVEAVGSNGTSSPSSPACATPQAPTTPNAPTGLTAKSAGKSGKINLAWTQSTSPNITQNKVYRATGTSTTYGWIATLSATTSYSDASTTKGTTYCYEVTAVNSSLLESARSNSSCAVAGATTK